MYTRLHLQRSESSDMHQAKAITWASMQVSLQLSAQICLLHPAFPFSVLKT